MSATKRTIRADFDGVVNPKAPLIPSPPNATRRSARILLDCGALLEERCEHSIYEFCSHANVSALRYESIAGGGVLRAGLRAMATTKAPSKVSFDITSSAPGIAGPRTGRLSFPGRATIDTPHYVAVSSRGAVPHISQDMIKSNTDIKSVYTGLEDCE